MAHDKNKYRGMAQKVKDWADHQTKSGGGNLFKFDRDKVEWFNPKVENSKPTTYNFDIVPYNVSIRNHPMGVDVGDPFWTRKWYRHRNIGPDGKTSVVCPKTFGKPCPICDYRRAKIDAEGYKKGEPDPYRPQEMDLFNVYDHGDPSKGVQIYSVPFNNFGKILKEEIDADDDAVFYFMPTDDGKTIKARYQEETFMKRTFISCSKIDFKDRDDGISPEIMDQVFDLDTVLIEKTYEEIQALFLGIIPDEKEQEKEETGKKDKDSKKEEVIEEEVIEEEVIEEKKKEEKLEPVRKKKEEVKKDEVKKEETQCPYGYEYGVKCNKEMECEDCAVWEDCMAEKDRLKRNK